MTVIETPTRDEVIAERNEIAARLCERYGTAERVELRDLSVSGEMTYKDSAEVERLFGLDYLLNDH